MTEVKWRKFKSYSGPFAKAKTEEIDIPTRLSEHWERAFWLTTMVESGGRPGLVNMYDGCGATCGLHQAVAVYPRDMEGDTQGPLWELLWRLNAVIPLRTYIINDLFEDVGWTLTGDGVYWTMSGEKVSAYDIRNELTPPEGKVPKSGDDWESAKEWATALSEIFTLKEGLGVQTQFGIEHMHRSARRVKIAAHERRKTIEDWCYAGKALKHSTGINSEIDLAMSLFWCNFINGPRPAKDALQVALEVTGGPDVDNVKFSRQLITSLGNNTYGRWDDDIPGGRYARAREHAMEVWPARLFNDDGIMPKDLPG